MLWRDDGRRRELREMTGDVGHIVWISDPASNRIELQQDPEHVRV